MGEQARVIGSAPHGRSPAERGPRARAGLFLGRQSMVTIHEHIILKLRKSFKVRLKDTDPMLAVETSVMGPLSVR